MFLNQTRVLLVLSQDVLDRARVMAGKATTTLKLPVSVQIVLRALIEEGLKRAAGVLFLYGDAGRLFIDRWLKEFVRKTSLLQVQPRLVALYQAPPKKKAEDEPLVPFDDLRMVGSQETFSLEPVEAICVELCGDRA